MSSKSELAALIGADLVSYGQARARDVAFDAVRRLWDRRKKEGMSQKDLADLLGMNEGRLSRVLNGPANLTFKTFGGLIAAMDGDFEIDVYANEDAPAHAENYAAYDEIELNDQKSNQKIVSIIEIKDVDGDVMATPIKDFEDRIAAV